MAKSSPTYLLHVRNLDSINNNSAKRYNKFTRTCLYKLYLGIDITKTYTTSSKLNISSSHVNFMY